MWKQSMQEMQEEAVSKAMQEAHMVALRIPET
jgi:hypothetical protein